jgi:hypothetical protein
MYFIVKPWPQKLAQRKNTLEGNENNPYDIGKINYNYAFPWPRKQIK